VPIRFCEWDVRVVFFYYLDLIIEKINTKEVCVDTCEAVLPPWLYKADFDFRVLICCIFDNPPHGHSIRSISTKLLMNSIFSLSALYRLKFLFIVDVIPDLFCSVLVYLTSPHVFEPVSLTFRHIVIINTLTAFNFYNLPVVPSSVLRKLIYVNTLKFLLFHYYTCFMDYTAVPTTPPTTHPFVKSRNTIS
jgi:hypothetical protein